MGIFGNMAVGPKNLDFSNVFDYLENIKKRQAAEKNAQAQLDLQKSAESRAQQLFPLQLQQAQSQINESKAKTDKINALRDYLTKNGMGMPSNDNNSSVGSPASNFANAAFGSAPSDTSENKEVEIRPGNKAQLAFLALQGGKIPEPKVSFNNDTGMIQTHYPDGRITVQKDPTFTGETPQEKGKRTLGEKESFEDYKQNKKDKSNIANAGKDLLKYANDNEAIARILERNPAATGRIEQAKNFLGTGSKDYAELARLSVPMVGELAKNLSTRGGAVALNYAQSGKFNPAKGLDYNQGILRANNRAIVQQYEADKDEYEKKFNETYPYRLPKYYQDWKQKNPEEFSNSADVVSMFKNGEQYHIPKEKAQAAEKAGYTYG